MKIDQAYQNLIKENYLAYTFAVQNAGLEVGKDKLRWTPSKLHKFLCNEVDKFIKEKTGNIYDILLISVGPQIGKSVTITETLPSFYLGNNPEHRVIEVSYGADFAVRFGKSNKQKVEEFGDIFGISVSKKGNSNVDWWLSNERGRMISRGVGSGVTGETAHLLIIDDPIKNSKDAHSETYRANLWNEWISSFRSRLAVGAKVIVIQTRWHEDDLYGRLLERDPYVKAINIESLCESEDDPLGREIGEGVCPEIGKGTEYFTAFKDAMVSGEVDEGGETGLQAWEALYQGNPTAKEGNILKREWWQYYDELPTFDLLMMSVDCSFKDNKDNDNVAIQVWGMRGADIYLVDAIREKLDFVDTVKVIRGMRAQYPRINQILVEDKANGPAVISSLRGEIMGIIAVTPQGGKVSRVHGVSGIIEAGNVYLPRNRDFTGWFIEECSSFPNGKHDDSVDCMSQALAKMMFMGVQLKAKPKEMSLTERAFRFKRDKPRIGKGDKVNVI
jgi:predicted phage terminase large subunit-like protein